jgi:hypothetical protein
MEAASEMGDARSRRHARAVLERIFGQVEPGLRYRLWDGSEGSIGRPDGSFTLVIRDRDTFRETFGSNDTKIMAEAFVDDRLDCDGDLFAGLRVANQLEDLRLRWIDKIQIYMELRGV